MSTSPAEIIARAGQDSIKSQMSTGGDGLPSIGARWSVLACDILAALEAEGFVVVPKEPTDEQFEAGRAYMDMDPEAVYAGMLAARPK